MTMSFGKPKGGLKRKPFMKRREESIIRTLHYQDSDEGSGQEDSGSSCPLWSPERKQLLHSNDDQPEFLELDIPDCAMISSPKSSRRILRRRARFSPNFEDVEEEAQQVPGSEVMSPESVDMSPPHRKLRALRLFDTPHTPKSLLEQARRRRPTGEKPKIAVDRPQANVNPFTPSPQTNHNDSGYCGSGKRSRAELERYSALQSNGECMNYFQIWQFFFFRKIGR